MEGRALSKQRARAVAGRGTSNVTIPNAGLGAGGVAAVQKETPRLPTTATEATRRGRAQEKGPKHGERQDADTFC